MPPQVRIFRRIFSTQKFGGGEFGYQRRLGGLSQPAWGVYPLLYTVHLVPIQWVTTFPLKLYF